MLVVSSLGWARRHKREFDAVITIEDPDLAGRPTYSASLRFHRSPAPAHLILRFFDLDEPLPAPYHRPWMRMAEPIDVANALAFAKLHEKLLIHCKAGIARSTALALAILMDRLHDPQAALAELLLLQPSAVPNLHLTAVADTVLGCDGKLLETLDVWDKARQTNTTRRFLCRMAHFYELGVPITASHERGELFQALFRPA